MSILQGVQTYYSLFGCGGVLFVTKARFSRAPVVAIVSVPGIKYPVKVRLRTTDVSVLRQVFVVGEYDCKFSKPPRVIVDAGANIGLTSVFYANKYPDAKVIAVEPEPSNFELLKKNIAPYPNVIPVRGALWKENKQLTLMNPDSRNDGFQTTDKAESSIDEKYGCVPGITVEKLMQDCDIDRIDVLKLDIEGSEKEVFENPSRWIDSIGTLVIELHDRVKAGCTDSVYQATTDFELHQRNGETLFFVKRDRSLAETSRPVSVTHPPGADPSQSKTKPFKILEAR